MTTTQRLITAAALASGLLTAHSALAAPPAARGIDQMVNLVADKNSTACPFYGYAVNQQVNPDGSVSPFSIPEGYSLVITGMNWYQNMTSGKDRFEGRLSIQGTSAVTILSDFRFDSGSTFQGGYTTGISDVAVKPGVVLCYGMPSWGVSATVLDVRVNVHGFLVKKQAKGQGQGDDH